MSQDPNGTPAGALMITSGVLNVVASGGFILAWGWLCFGLAWIFPLMIGLAEIAIGAAIMGGRPTSRVRGISALGIVASLMCFNVFSVGLEIGSLVLQSRSSDRLLEG